MRPSAIYRRSLELGILAPVPKHHIIEHKRRGSKDQWIIYLSCGISFKIYQWLYFSVEESKNVPGRRKDSHFSKRCNSYTRSKWVVQTLRHIIIRKYAPAHIAFKRSPRFRLSKLYFASHNTIRLRVCLELNLK